MRGDLPPQMEAIWRRGDFTGRNRPMARVTVQKPMMRLHTFSMMSTFRRVPPPVSDIGSFNPYPSGIDPSRGDPVTNIYANFLHTPPEKPFELTNVKHIQWSRTTDADVAEATIELWNTRPMPIGEKPQNGDLDLPGFYTAGRGTTAFSSRWNHEPNDFSRLLVPDNIIRTYEGYGTDLLDDPLLTPETCPPERDSRLVLTGTWIIDEVTLGATGVMSVRCRDLGRLLLDHIAFLPVVTDDFYPLSFNNWGEKVTVQTKRNVVVDTRRRDRLPCHISGSGNDNWPESAYLGARRHGHDNSHAMDGDSGTYWLSVGNDNPAYRSSYEYIDIAVPNMTVNEVRFWTVGSGYNCYVAVKQGGAWLPGPEVNYRRDGRGRYEEGNPYVASANLQGEGEHVIALGQIPNTTLIRLWFNNLPNFNLPGSKYRAAVREIAVMGEVGALEVREVVDVNEVALTPGPAGSNPGRCQDYTDVVKLLCAWAGLYWPADGIAYHSDGTAVPNRPVDPDDETLGDPVDGRVWGDFQDTGTAPLAQILASAFDKKTLMDGIAYIRDMVGFLFAVDETGGVQWRMPNIWTLGNWVTTGPNPGRSRRIHMLDERQVIMGLDATIQSRNVREAVFVGNVIGKQAAMVGGYNPNDTGLRRVAGWTDQHFSTVEESRVMADLIAVRALFKYRTDQIVIPAFPGIQIDDQVRVFERVTSEGFVHYVKGISSSMDLVTGRWEYNLQTHWLGDDPDGAWVVNTADLSSTTIAYVDALQGGPMWARGTGV